MQTMSDEEMLIMRQHIGYWKSYIQKGTMVVFGPIFDPEGMYGLGVVSAENDEELQLMLDNDPGIAINSYEHYMMMSIAA